MKLFLCPVLMAAFLSASACSKSSAPSSAEPSASPAPSDERKSKAEGVEPAAAGPGKGEAPAPLPKPNAPQAPKPVPMPGPRPSPSVAPNGQACAERLILVAAKKNVAKQYGNRPESGGYCATGVRTSLQLSKVGNITAGLGNAVDYLKALPPHGFLDNGGRDPRSAPPGSVLVFSGPYTASYFKNGHYGSPAGNWLGHVTIKGDDGHYYTDGRTVEPAIGWKNGLNTAHERNMAGMFVPTAALSAQYVGKCSNITAVEQVADLTLDTAEVAALPLEDPAARENGQRLVAQGMATLQRGSSPEVFALALSFARDGAGFDEEGQLAHALADRLAADSTLMAQVDQFTSSRAVEHGLEACKTKVLINELARNLCLKKAGAQGQDVNEAGCEKPLNWSSCLATESWR